MRSCNSKITMVFIYTVTDLNVLSYVKMFSLFINKLVNPCSN